jgi:hypothetical protein
MKNKTLIIIDFRLQKWCIVLQLQVWAVPYNNCANKMIYCLPWPWESLEDANKLSQNIDAIEGPLCESSSETEMLSNLSLWHPDFACTQNMWWFSEERFQTLRIYNSTSGKKKSSNYFGNVSSKKWQRRKIKTKSSPLLTGNQATEKIKDQSEAKKGNLFLTWMPVRTADSRLRCCI